MSIEFSNVYYVYSPKSPFEYEALKDINISLEKGKFIALVGRTGSGKSTLIQMINALLTPSKGEVKVDSFINSPDKKRRSKNISELRKKVGLVFQFPEYQLFEETVEKDVAFGPKNFGSKNEEALKIAHEALKKVGLDESFYARSPFELSGGEKRKVAIAGILALSPEVLIVDEPTAGLDPKAAEETMALFESIHQEGVSIILVTHDMNLVAEFADEAVVMENGKIVKHCKPEELFGDDLSAYSLENPHIFQFALDLQRKGLQIDPKNLKNVKDMASAIKRAKHV
ncbi:MAG: energy-coupling factor transporter ATPase [Bacilli bacterium]|jgi:energy-coupling factor transport system ATP-binding protein|nr:energy-coupling factor transporter ATPase [Bacilli bacterium]MCH4210763.1 energy-coupling factor transporter ATPase [Bacilli bacterium]MCI2055358.1 energy-coupling factor transporter ATPase [Bacilli bacterium]